MPSARDAAERAVQAEVVAPAHDAASVSSLEGADGRKPPAGRSGAGLAGKAAVRPDDYSDLLGALRWFR